MLKLLFVSFLFTLLFTLSSEAFGMAVQGTVTSKVSVFKQSSESICRSRALRRQPEALRNLWQDANDTCPTGFKVKEGPICNSYQGVHVKKRKWTLSYFCSYSCFANIKCTEDEQYPEFDPERVNKEVSKNLEWLIHHPFPPGSQLIIIEKRE